MVAKAYFQTTVSGSFTVDVTDCQLCADTNVKDFIVIVDGTVISNSYWEKTSSTILTYTGADFGGIYSGEVRRHTTPARVQELKYLNRLPLAYYEGELNRCTERAEEASVYGVGPQSLSIDYIPLNDAYNSAAWDADTVYAPTRKAISNKLETLAPIDSPAFTGTPTTPEPPSVSDNSTKIATTAHTTNKTLNALSGSPVLGGNPTCATQAWNNDSTRIASTAFVQDAILGRCIVHASRTTNLSGGDVLTLIWNNETTDPYSAYDSTNGRFVPPWNGWYRFNICLNIEATWGSTAEHANVVQLYKDGSVLQVGGIQVCSVALAEWNNTAVYSFGSYDTLPVYLVTTSYYTFVSNGTSSRTSHTMRPPSYLRVWYIGTSLTDF